MGEVTVGDGTNYWYGITSSDDGTKLAAVAPDLDADTPYDDKIGGTIWTSTNIGATWIQVTMDDQLKYFTAITSSDDGATVSVAEYEGKIWSGPAGLQCIACATGYVRPAGDWVDDGETACSFRL